MLFNRVLCRSVLVAVAVVGIASTSFAQSAAPSVPASSVAPSHSSIATPPVGLDGYCPVCVVEMKQWMKGDTSIQANFDGKTYYFPGEEQRKMFMANPEKYAPALGGDCTVCLTDMKKKMPGSVQFSALHKNRLFLFPSDEVKKKFLADPNKYAKAEIAMDGNCAVCQVEMKKTVPGKAEIATTYGGKRYLFPGEDQRKMFLANPTKYAENSQAPPSPVDTHR